MTVTWISPRSGKFNDYRECIFYLDDGTTTGILAGLIYEYADAYKIYDDTAKSIIILWKSKLRKIEFKVDNYEWFKQDKIDEMKEKVFKQ